MTSTLPSTVASATTQAPPSTPGVNYYIVPTSATGAWASNPLQIAWYENSAWKFAVPTPGVSVWVTDQGLEITWNGTGWVGQAQGGTSDIYAHYYTLTTQTFTSSWALLNFEGKLADTNYACSITPWKFTCPEAGNYVVSTQVLCASTSTSQLGIYINSVQYIVDQINSSGVALNGSISFYCNKGDTIQVGACGTSGTLTVTSSNNQCSYVTISRSRPNLLTTTIGGTQASGMIPQLNSVGQLDPTMVPTGTTLGGSILQNVMISGTSITVPASVSSTYATTTELCNSTLTPKSVGSKIKIFGNFNSLNNAATIYHDLYLNAASAPTFEVTDSGANGFVTNATMAYEFTTTSLSPIVLSFRSRVYDGSPSSTVSASIIIEEVLPLSQNVNLASSFQEFAANNSTTTANDSTSFVNGATAQAGVAFQAFAPGTVNVVQKTVQFANSIQSSDSLVLEINTGSGWVANFLSPGTVLGSTTQLCGCTVQPSSSNQALVSFYSYAFPTTGWSGVTSWKWRVRKISNGNWAESTFQGQVGAWTAYTPVWTASTTNPSLGNGSLVGYWRRNGDSMDIALLLTTGSTTNFGSGQYYFSLPANYTINSSAVSMGNYSSVGTIYAQPTGVGPNQAGIANVPSTTQLSGALPAGMISNTIPGTWSASYTNLISMKATVPIAQWGSNINLATDFTEYLSCDGTVGVAANTAYTPTTTYGSQGSNIPAVTISSSTATTSTTYNLTTQTAIKSTDLLQVEFNNGNGWIPLSQGPSAWASVGAIQGSVPMGLYVQVAGTNTVQVIFSNAGRYPSSTYGTANSGTWAAFGTSFKWRVRKTSNGNMAQQTTTAITKVMDNATNASGALNLSSTLTTSGGPVKFEISGGGYGTGVGSLSFNLLVDGSIVGNSSSAYVPNGTTSSVITKSFYMPTLAAGLHTVSIVNAAGSVLQTNGTYPWSVLAEEFVPAGVITPQDRLTSIANSEVLVTGTTTATTGCWNKCTATTANYALTIPLASTCVGRYLGVRIDPSSTYLVTLTASGSDTIDGSTTRVMWAKEVAELYSDGTTWTKVGGKSIPMIGEMTITANQTFAASTWAQIAWDTLIETAPFGMVDTVNHRIVAPRTSRYTITGNIRWNNNNGSAGVRDHNITISSSTNTLYTDDYCSASSSLSKTMVDAGRVLNTGDTVVVNAYYSGGSFATSCFIVMGRDLRFQVVETPQW